MITIALTKIIKCHESVWNSFKIMTAVNSYRKVCIFEMLRLNRKCVCVWAWFVCPVTCRRAWLHAGLECYLVGGDRVFPALFSNLPKEKNLIHDIELYKLPCNCTLAKYKIVLKLNCYKLTRECQPPYIPPPSQIIMNLLSQIVVYLIYLPKHIHKRVIHIRIQ